MPGDALQFDLGKESDNLDRFRALVVAFPLLLLAIHVLLALQFRSLFQPALIFTVIPFTLHGISASLYATDNPFSLFAMFVFFSLIWLSIKYTILLTYYANQSCRSGSGPIEAVTDALAECFRPLAATSLTAVISLIPFQ